jgi:hypothetical protein
MTTRPGWYPDPSGRFPKRWYDGYDWTASVLDNNGQQAFDQLPPARAPAVASLPAAAPPAPTSPPPPPPPGSGVGWPPQQPVTTASLGLTPPPAVRMSSGTRTNPLVYGLVLLAIAALVLSMFVVDWYSEAGRSLGFRDFGEGSILSSAPLLDKVTFWNYQWLGFVVAGLALLSVFVFVIFRAGSHRIGHVIAAIDATIGAVLSTFAIVRLFRTDEFDPEVGAWLLPAGYLVLLVATLISARNEPA